MNGRRCKKLHGEFALMMGRAPQKAEMKIVARKLVDKNGVALGKRALALIPAKLLKLLRVGAPIMLQNSEWRRVKKSYLRGRVEKCTAARVEQHNDGMSCTTRFRRFKARIVKRCDYVIAQLRTMHEVQA